MTTQLSTDEQFVSMLCGYRETGGLAREREVLALFHRCHGPDVATLSTWIAERELICFEWQSQPWLPMFQFDRARLRPDQRLRAVFSELNHVYDPWDLGAWFAYPNSWLNGMTPVQTYARDLPAVVNAARADRFIACG